MISFAETDYDTDPDNYDTETEDDWNLHLDESSTGLNKVKSLLWTTEHNEVETSNGIAKENNDPDTVNMKGNTSHFKLDIQNSNLDEMETSYQNLSDQSKEAIQVDGSSTQVTYSESNLVGGVDQSKESGMKSLNEQDHLKDIELKLDQIEQNNGLHLCETLSEGNIGSKEKQIESLKAVHKVLGWKCVR